MKAYASYEAAEASSAVRVCGQRARARFPALRVFARVRPAITPFVLLFKANHGRFTPIKLRVYAWEPGRLGNQDISPQQCPH